jgi:hypothetical protein
MKAIFVAIATIALAGCTTYPNEEVRKADLAATPIATSALAGEDEIRPSCEEKWAGEYAMIALCVETQTQGFRDVQRLLEEHNIRNGDTTPEAKIFADCSRKWRRSHGRPNWPMIASCFERQWAGYRQLYPLE